MATMIPIALSVAGTVFQAVGQIQAGQSQQAAYNYEAQIARTNADQALAASQRAAIQRQREGTLAIETAQARAAGSGGGATDPTVLNIEGNLRKQGTYNALTELYSGSEQARGLQQEASTDVYKGDLASSAGYRSAFGTAISGVDTLYSNYGGGGPGNNALPTTVVPGSGWNSAYGSSGLMYR